MSYGVDKWILSHFVQLDDIDYLFKSSQIIHNIDQDLTVKLTENVVKKMKQNTLELYENEATRAFLQQNLIGATRKKKNTFFSIKVED